MTVESELREFLVSAINFDDLDEHSRNMMFKSLISAYCQMKTIFEARITQLEYDMQNKKEVQAYNPVYGRDY